jgi:hypothetical protein
MKREGSGEAARDFFSEVLSLYENLFREGFPKTLSLAEIETLDLAPLSHTQARLDRFGMEALSDLPLEDQVLLAHLQGSIIEALAPFAREDGPLAARIQSLSGNGPLSAYRKASMDRDGLWGQKVIGRL